MAKSSFNLFPTYGNRASEPEWVRPEAAVQKLNRMPLFEHFPLMNAHGQIRLLRCNKDAMLAGEWEIKTFNLESAPPYQALSYTWGSIAEPKNLIIKGRRLLLSESLMQFLNTGTGRDGWWWIDQIAIDQANIKERSAQVSIMSSIYNNASKVVIWLAGLSSRTCQILDINFSQLFQNNTGSQALALRLESAGDFITHEYWSRVWTIQEVAYAKKVDIAYGTGRLRLAQVRAVVDWCEKSGFLLPADFEWFIQHATGLHGTQGTQLHRLDTLVQVFSDSGCKDPRDKVFGIQGLLKPEHRLQVDYDKPIEAVFFDAMQVMVRQWREEEVFRELISVCLHLGAQMLPAKLAIHSIFDQLGGLNEAMHAEVEVNERKRRIVEAFHQLVFRVGGGSSWDSTLYEVDGVD